MSLLYHTNWSVPAVAAGTDDTPLSRGVPGCKLGKVALRRLRFLPGTAAKAIAFMHPLGFTRVLDDALASATSLRLARDPGNYAANAITDQRGTAPSVANNLIAANDY